VGLIFILPTQKYQTLGKILFFYLVYSFGSCQITRVAKLNLANSWRCSNNNENENDESTTKKINIGLDPHIKRKPV
jgi:hypothetical protein